MSWRAATARFKLKPRAIRAGLFISGTWFTICSNDGRRALVQLLLLAPGLLNQWVVMVVAQGQQVTHLQCAVERNLPSADDHVGEAAQRTSERALGAAGDVTQRLAPTGFALRPVLDLSYATDDPIADGLVAQQCRRGALQGDTLDEPSAWVNSRP